MTSQALRSLRKSPAYALTAILTLGVGIGMTTAAFSLLNGFVLRPLPFASPEPLVDVSEWSASALCAGCGVGTSRPVFREWQRATRSFAGLEAVVEEPYNMAGGVSGDRAAERVSGASASAGLFALLGIQPVVGRSFTPDDDRPGAAPVAIVSHEIWRERLDSGSLANATLRLNGASYTVVGVMPPGFGFPEFARVWVPLGASTREWPPDERTLAVVGRLRDGVSLYHARDEMTSVARDIAARYPSTHDAWTVRVTPLRENMAGEESQLSWLLIAMMLVVLLIACVNLAGVGLARAAGRQRELAVRAAMGARATDLIRLLLLESLWLSLGGGVLGVFLAMWGVDLARAMLPAQMPFWLRFDLDWRVFAFCAAVTFTAGTASGLLPAWHSARPELVPALKQGTGASSDGRMLRFWLVGGELALSVVLLVSAGLLTRTFARTVAYDPGYNTDSLLTGEVGLFGPRYEGAGATLFANGVLEGLPRHRGLSSAAVSHTAFVAGFGGSDQVMEAEGGPAPPGASARFAHSVTPGYFDAFGLDLLAGRDFTSADRAGAAPVAIVNEALASRVWAGESPLGRRLRLPGGQWLTIIGVVGNVAGSALAIRSTPPPNIYLPFAQAPGRPVSIHVRAAGDPYSMAPALREVVRLLDADQPVENILSADDAHARWALPARVLAVMGSAVAGLALVLAAIGLYGVVSYTVSRRTREFGIRLAIGATRGDVLMLVLGQALMVTVVGLAVGLVAAAASTWVLRTMLFGTSPLDPVVFTSSAATLVAIMTISAMLPARRAARTSPQVALRDE